MSPFFILTASAPKILSASFTESGVNSLISFVNFHSHSRRTILFHGKHSEKIETLETKYDDDAGDWYVALGWEEKRVIVKMDSVLAEIIEIKEI